MVILSLTDKQPMTIGYCSSAMNQPFCFMMRPYWGASGPPNRWDAFRPPRLIMLIQLGSQSFLAIRKDFLVILHSTQLMILFTIVSASCQWYGCSLSTGNWYSTTIMKTRCQPIKLVSDYHPPFPSIFHHDPIFIPHDTMKQKNTYIINHYRLRLVDKSHY